MFRSCLRFCNNKISYIRRNSHVNKCNLILLSHSSYKPKFEQFFNTIKYLISYILFLISPVYNSSLIQDFSLSILSFSKYWVMSIYNFFVTFILDKIIFWFLLPFWVFFLHRLLLLEAMLEKTLMHSKLYWMNLFEMVFHCSLCLEFLMSPYNISISIKFSIDLLLQLNNYFN